MRGLVPTNPLYRGIAIDILPSVINYELPRSPNFFIHRIGRTGRTENSGEAIAFGNFSMKTHFKVIERKMK